MQSIGSTSSAPLAGRPSEAPFFSGFLRALYIHNPFYLLSAGLILYGLHLVFHPEEGQLINPWALLASLCGYTALLAATAFGIVRFGKVWEDARSLLLVLLLQLLALSVSFDEIVNTSSREAYALMLFGLAFSTVVSESLFRGLNLRLPWLFRGPYYGILALFFIYPLFVSPEVTELRPKAIDLRIFFFPVAAGLSFLTLIPGIRRGAKYVRDNGTPWRWPWFPWAAFAFLALGVCLRSYGLSLSFSPADGMESTFGLYYLVPFLLVLLVLLLEIGFAESKPLVQNAALFLSPLLLVLSIPKDGSGAPYREFLTTLVQAIGSPVYVTLLGLCLFYAYAWFRGHRAAEWGLTATLLLAIFVGRRTVNVATLVAPQWESVAVLAGIQTAIALTRPGSIRSVAAAVCDIAALWIALRDTAFTASGGAILLHLALLATLVIGAVFSDRLAFLLRRGSFCAIIVLGTAALFADRVASIRTDWRTGYLVFLTAVTLIYGRLTRDSWFFVAGGINAACVAVSVVSSLHGVWIRSVGSRGFHQLIWGAVCFLVAAAISALKSGLFRTLPPERLRANSGISHPEPRA